MRDVNSSGSTGAPIGIFDSGFGGLTVARSVIDQLPHESIVYVGDTARQPYGPKPIGEVREYALECLDHLVEQGVKALVIACNSASAAMLRDARERYDVPVVEVIYPATRRAVAASRTGRIGVICTRATAESMAYDDAFAAAPHVQLFTQPCPRFVDFVEAGITGGDELIGVAHEYLDPLVSDGVDTLVLGCTHYPLLTGVISYVMGDNVTLVSSAEECAKDVYKMLVRTDLMRPGGEPTYTFLTTGAPAEFETIGRRFLGPEMVAAVPVRRWSGMRLTVVGCSGSYPGPDSPASCYLLEADDADGRTWRVLLDLGNGALGALQRYVDPLDDRRGAAQPPARRPLPGPVRLLRAAQVPPRRRPAADPGLGPGRHRRPDGARLRPAGRPGHDHEFDFREWDGADRDRSVPVDAGARRAPGRRRSACGSAPTARVLAYTGDTGPCAGRRRRSPRRRPVPRRGVLPQRRRQPARPAPHRHRLRRGRGPLRREPARADPRPAVARPGDALAEARSAYDGPVELARPGAVHHLP